MTLTRPFKGALLHVCWYLPCSYAVFTGHAAGEHGRRTRVVCTELKGFLPRDAIIAQYICCGPVSAYHSSVCPKPVFYQNG